MQVLTKPPFFYTAPAVLLEKFNNPIMKIQIPFLKESLV